MCITDRVQCAISLKLTIKCKDKTMTLFGPHLNLVSGDISANDGRSSLPRWPRWSLFSLLCSVSLTGSVCCRPLIKLFSTNNFKITEGLLLIFCQYLSLKWSTDLYITKSMLVCLLESSHITILRCYNWTEWYYSFITTIGLWFSLANFFIGNIDCYTYKL